MATLNRVFLIGNLTRDPELRYTPGGVAISSFTLAVSTPIGKDDAGNQKKDVLYIDVVAFGRQAEVIAEYLKKGRPVFVEGRLRYRTWEDASGNKRAKHEIILNSFQFLGPRKQEEVMEPVEVPTEEEDIPF